MPLTIDESAPIPPPDIPGDTPVYATNQTELGHYLTPPRDRKMIQRGMKKSGCPGRTPDGRYHIAQWQEFMAATFDSHAADDTGDEPTDKQSLEIEKLRLQNEKLTFELSVKKKDFSANTDIEQWVGEMVMSAKRVLQQIPSKLAPQVVGMTEVEAETRMKEEINAALDQLTTRPWNTL